jgi:hypothetical protein
MNLEPRHYGTRPPVASDVACFPPFKEIHA